MTQPSATAAAEPAQPISHFQGIDPSGRFLVGTAIRFHTSFRNDLVTDTSASPFSRAIVLSGDMNWVVTYGDQTTATDPKWRDINSDVEISIPMAHPAGTYFIPVTLSDDGQLLLVGLGSSAYGAGGAGWHGSPTVVGRDGSIDASPVSGAQGVDMSANGRWVLLRTPCASDTGLNCHIHYLWDRETGTVTPLAVPTSDGVFAIDDDGAYVTTTNLDGNGWTVLRRDRAGCATELLTPSEVLTHTAMRASLDGSALVLLDSSQHVVVIDTATGSRSFPEPALAVDSGNVVMSSDGAFVAFRPKSGPFGENGQLVVRPVPAHTVQLGPCTGGDVSLAVAGVRGVPADASSVALNVTVVNPATAGFATVWPCGVTRPTTSNVNFVGGQTVANAVLASVGTGGAVCLYSNVGADLVVDVQGYFTGSAYTGVTPDRFLDTRNGDLDAVANVAAHVEVPLAIEGVRAVPGEVASVALNVTVVNPALAGYVTVWPCGASRPPTSNVNFVGGQTVANAVVASVGDGGAVCLYSNVAVDLVVDVQGYFTGTAYTGMGPDRFLDTRNGDLDAVANVAAEVEVPLVVEGVRGMPTDVASVALNVTVVNPALAGFVTVWPCGVPRPTTSNVNFVGGQTVANAVLAAVGAGGVCMYSNVAVDLVVDVAGYFTGTAYTGITPDRFLDTRA